MAREMGERQAETGRDLFDFRPRVDFKIKHVFDSASGERVVAQLRTGYAKLNELFIQYSLNIYIRSVLWIVISASVEKLSQSVTTCYFAPYMRKREK